MLNRISVVEGDITKQQVDAIVNAANTELRGSGGVDGAIHRGAGPALLDACRFRKILRDRRLPHRRGRHHRRIRPARPLGREIGGCPTGEAVITDGFALPARWVIHTAGPVWRGGSNDEDFMLASCYRNSLGLAGENAVQTIAFPAISTGIYGFPAPRAARIAVTETIGFLHRHDRPESVVLVCFDGASFDCHQAALTDIIA